MITKRIYECKRDKISVITDLDSSISESNNSIVYIVDIVSENRDNIIDELHKLGINETICDRLLTTEEDIRFKYIEGTLYGEISYFSSKSKKSSYVAIIVKDNLLITVHPSSESVIAQFIDTLPNLANSSEDDFIPEFIVYSMILDILSGYSKLILSYRKEIERLAHNIENSKKELSLKDISESKSQLATLEMALDKLYFTLSFPPSKSMLNFESPYSGTFNYLLRNVSMLKSYIDQNQDRLDSLNDHYQLLLHDKANKRLNFLTITQAIFVPLTLVVGVYGMNFKYMPELTYKYGYFITLGSMIIVAILFLIYFRRRGWFD